jgi:hypothetical protein
MFMSGVATGLFLNWNERADLEDARNFALDQATIAALRVLAALLMNELKCALASTPKPSELQGRRPLQLEPCKTESQRFRSVP